MNTFIITCAVHLAKAWVFQPWVKQVVDKRLAELARAPKPTIGFHIRWGDKIEEDILFVRTWPFLSLSSDALLSNGLRHVSGAGLTVAPPCRNGRPPTPRTTSSPLPKTSQVSRYALPGHAACSANMPADELLRCCLVRAGRDMCGRR